MNISNTGYPKRCDFPHHAGDTFKRYLLLKNLNNTPREREASGYDNVVHISGLEGVMMYTNERGPSGANNLSSMRSELIFATLDTRHQPTVITDLGL